MWRTIRNLNSNLTAGIRTKHGLTRDINIKDSIRQGGVLSVAEYSNIIDEIAKTISKEGIGKVNIRTTQTTGCPLWMDDVALLHKDHHQLQNMLDITEELAQRFHIKFGKEKNQVVNITKKDPHTFNLGQTKLEPTNKYKYLGMVINNQGNKEDHITNLKGKVEASLQTILNIVSYPFI